MAEKPTERGEQLDSIEGTVITEADSGPCDSGEALGGVAGGVAREEEGSCEAEARETSSTESQGIFFPPQICMYAGLNFDPSDL